MCILVGAKWCLCASVPCISKMFIESFSYCASGLSDIKGRTLWAQSAVYSIYSILAVASSCESCMTCITRSASTWAWRGTVSRPYKPLSYALSPFPRNPKVEATVPNYSLYFIAQAIVYERQHQWCFVVRVCLSLVSCVSVSVIVLMCSFGFSSCSHKYRGRIAIIMEEPIDLFQAAVSGGPRR